MYHAELTACLISAWLSRAALRSGMAGKCSVRRVAIAQARVVSSEAPHGGGGPRVDMVNDAFKKSSGFMVKSSKDDF